MAKRNTRDLGLSGGSGKGDAPRHKLNDAWREAYGEITWGKPVSQDESFSRAGNSGTFVKRYGPADVVPFEQLRGKIIVN